jgi:biotin/methionine sulfoxide reductase
MIVARGIKIIHVSPLKDDLPDWSTPNGGRSAPNTDTALMLGLAGEIVKADRHDRELPRSLAQVVRSGC